MVYALSYLDERSRDDRLRRWHQNNPGDDGGIPSRNEYDGGMRQEQPIVWWMSSPTILQRP